MNAVPATVINGEIVDLYRIKRLETTDGFNFKERGFAWKYTLVDLQKTFGNRTFAQILEYIDREFL